MEVKYVALSPQQPAQKGSCATIIGFLFAGTYAFTQFAFLTLIGISLTHQVIVLFSMFAWALMTLEAAANLFLAFLMCCAFCFDVNTWRRFKTFLTPYAILQGVIHVGLPTLFEVLFLISEAEEKKALYDTLFLTFTPLSLLDGLVFVGMIVPYYCMYTTFEGEEIHKYKDDRWVSPYRHKQLY